MFARHRLAFVTFFTLTLFICVPAFADDPDFSGNWNSTYGSMRLVQDGAQVTGSYSYSSGSSIVGTVDGNRLTFRYAEPSAAGDGWFELSDDGDALNGQWREDGSTIWAGWTASRVGAHPNRRWLYVIEAYWENSLAEPEYAFGDMLRSWFARYPDVEVRQRRVYSGADLRAALAEVAYLEEPVAVWIASHGTGGQLSINGEYVPASVVAEALAAAPSVFAVHFSSCEMGIGDGLQTVRAALTAPDAVVSGFAVSVDWSASALIEIAYLDLMLGLGMRPAAAYEQIQAELPMSGDQGLPGSPFGAASLRAAR
jgi:hypothetical protein